MYTDTHCHIYKEYYNDIKKVLDDSINSGINRWINNGCDSESNIEVVELVNKYNNMYGALGIHPEYVNKYNSKDINYIINNLNNKKIIAIGEIGLDYYYTKENKEEQIKLFEKQLEIAEKYNLPIIVHSREATLDTLNTIKKYNVKGVIHSFNGSLETAKEYIKLGFSFGVNGVITFKNANIKEVIKNIPLDNILIETDSPYLTPEPFRGKQNNSSHIKEIAIFLCNLYNISEEELISITNNNIKRIFNI